MTPSRRPPAAQPAGAAVPRRKALLYGASSLAVLASGLGGGMLARRPAPAGVAPSFRRLTFRRGLIRSARLAPDGQTILYGALWDGEPMPRAHRVASTAPNRARSICPMGTCWRSRDPARSRSRSDRTSTGSSPTARWRACRWPAVRRVQMVEDVKFADWSPDGSDLAIVRRVDGRDRLEFPIGKVLVQPAAGEGTGLGFRASRPTASAWRSSITDRPVSLFGKVAIVDQAGTVTTLSDEYLNVHGLAWKGDEIWYTAADEQPLFRALWAVTPGGARARSRGCPATRRCGTPRRTDAS